MIQIESAGAPFNSPRLAFQAVTALVRAEAIGLLPPGERIETLDLSSFRRASAIFAVLESPGTSTWILPELLDPISSELWNA
jgi:hypothetical protein